MLNMEKWTSVWIVALVLGSASGQVVLAQNGESDYEIVPSETATRTVKLAAAELQHFLEQSTDVRLLIAIDGAFEVHRLPPLERVVRLSRYSN